jgi:hypothetical protein
MSAEFLLKVADVLEKSAALYDQQETEKTASVEKARQVAVKDLSEKYAAATGEELPDDVLNKLAGSDEGVLNTVQRLMEKKASEGPERLGGSGEVPTNKAPQSRAEKKQAAFDNFGRYIVEG